MRVTPDEPGVFCHGLNSASSPRIQELSSELGPGLVTSNLPCTRRLSLVPLRLDEPPVIVFVLA